MTKSELIDAVANKTNITKSRAELVINCIFDAMTDALKHGEGIEIRGLGSFTVRQYKPYNGRNPRTGAPVEVAAKRLPFACSIGFERIFNQRHYRIHERVIDMCLYCCLY